MGVTSPASKGGLFGDGAAEIWAKVAGPFFIFEAEPTLPGTRRPNHLPCSPSAAPTREMPSFVLATSGRDTIAGHVQPMLLLRSRAFVLAALSHGGA
jgi:hypothetical protein